MRSFLTRDSSIWKYIATAAILGVVIAIVAFAAIDEAARRDEFWVEVGAAGVQLGVISAIGTVLAVALKQREERQEQVQRKQDQEREARRIRDDYYLNVMQRLREAYDDTKRARRSLQAAGLTTHPQVVPANLSTGATADAYAAAISEINNAQLVFEGLMRELEVRMTSTSSRSELTGKLRTIESYLNEVVKEHNRQYCSAQRSGNQSLSMSLLPNLDAFTHQSPRVFRAHVSIPYHAIVKLLHDEMHVPI